MTEVSQALIVEVVAKIDKLVAGMKIAADSTGDFAAAAGRHLEKAQASFNGVNFEVVTTKAKAETLKLIQLQSQLDVARIAGDKKTAAALQEQISLLQKIRQLKSVGLNSHDAEHAAEAQLAAVAAAEKREKRGNLGAALQSTFDRTRLGVLEEGGAKLPIFGSALEEIGPAGLAAAAALFAFGEAAEQAEKAIEFTEELEKGAQRIGVTTAKLQEFDFVALKSGVAQEAFRASLQRGNETFGAYISNLGDAKVKDAFKALGISKEQARGLGDFSEALPLIADRIQKIGNISEQSKIAQKLGLEEILPSLLKGGDYLRDSAKEAHELGVVLDGELVKKGAEFAEKIKITKDEIDHDLKRAFIGLAPEIETILKLLARMAQYAADTAENLKHPFSFHPEDQSTEHLKRDQAGAKAIIEGAKTDPYDFIKANGFGDNAKKVYAAATKELEKREKEEAEETEKLRGKRPVALAPEKTAKAEDQTAAFDKSATDAYQSALKGLNTALAALTADVDKHADYEKAAVDDELAKKLADLAKQEGDIRKSKNDAHKAEQLALIEKAKTEEQNAALAKKELIQRNAEIATRKAALERDAELTGYTDRTATAKASLSPDATTRAKVELENFHDEQNTASAAKREELNNQVASGAIDQGDADTRLGAFKDTQQAELIAKRVSVARQTNPLYNLANPTTSITDDLKGVEAQGLKGLTDGLSGVVTGTKSVADAFRDMATSIIGDLARIAIQRSIEQPLANLLFGQQNGLGNLFATAGNVSIGNVAGAATTSGDELSAALSAGASIFGFPGLAGGSDSATGGPTLVGEGGPELLNLPRGSQVVPNATLRGLANMDLSSLGRGAQSTSHNIKIDLTGANGDATIRAIAHDAAAQGTLAAIAVSRSDQTRAARAQRNNASGY